MHVHAYLKKTKQTKNILRSPVKRVRYQSSSFLLHSCFFKWAAPCEYVSLGICGQRRPRSACASAQSDHGLHCLLIKSLNVQMDSKGPDDTLRMRRMMFAWRGLYKNFYMYTKFVSLGDDITDQLHMTFL